ncbi:oligopeptide transporter 2 [Populus alba x Populus x berolinensis]|uniref:Oligopeptide transporter 2 n=1 Tax=Populus alba x Populus x berolinensis TaxID=444605 RepID=A0AAD6WBT6_9ROSI|nr:oligopeptide transporter 2 [Populus alba x Populus x berolinensis]
MWFLGIASCIILSFLNTFFSYRTEPLTISMISVQVVTLPIGRFMAKTLPTTKFRVPGFGGREFSLNPGPFNVKEHVLISIFANVGSSTAYAVGIIDIIMAFYKRKISFLASWILVLTTQMLGYGWAGIMRKYVVDPAEMWWPLSLMQVSLFRALHEKDNSRMSRGKFFLIALICSFSWYVFPGYLFPAIGTISWVCWAFPKSVTAQQLGSGMRGLGIGAFGLDWSVIASIYNAKTFPIFSSHLFDNKGHVYNVSAIVDNNFELDVAAFQRQGNINLSVFFSLTYGIGFAAIMSTLTHVLVFNGKEIWQQFRASYKGKMDVHTRLMKRYEDIPGWWFHLTLVLSFLLSLVLCIVMKDQVQMPWWALIFASGLALIFTLPVSVITATTNQTPGLNIITEYIMGLIYPGRPIANVCFKTYGYISMTQAVSFLSDFKLGHYMKIPPRSMFVVQCIGTLINGTLNTAVAWWLLTGIENICQDELLPPNSPWTCPGDRVFYDASVIWGLIGPARIFGRLGNYTALNWFFLGGVLGPVLQKWIKLINLPVLLGSTAAMPPATTVNFNCWIVVAITFNYFIFKFHKVWWQRYNYVLSAALDAGLAFMGVLLYFSLTMKEISLNWWGAAGEHCPLATCPTAKGVIVDGCPVY